MGTEIERKFRVVSEDWRSQVSVRQTIFQGYFERTGRACVRVRVVDGVRGFLTVKDAGASGMARAEYEYGIPVPEAEAMIRLFCGSRVVRKIRHVIPAGSLRWEVDEFLGRHAPLVIAEIELPAPDASFERPPWAGEELTGQVCFSNESLALGNGSF